MLATPMKENETNELINIIVISEFKSVKINYVQNILFIFFFLLLISDNMIKIINRTYCNFSVFNIRFKEILKLILVLFHLI